MILLKVSKKLWGLRLLMNNGGTVQDGKKFYQSWILSQLEGMVPVWHGRLSAQQRDSLEKVQRRSCKIILKKGYISYANALHVLNLKTLHERRETLCYRFTKKAAKHHPTLYPKKVSSRPTRLAETEQLVVPTFKSEIHKRGGKVFLTNLYNSKQAVAAAQTVQEPPLPTMGNRKGRCGACLNCLKANCEVCKYCKDMPKFGGKNKLKKACAERECLG